MFHCGHCPPLRILLQSSVQRLTRAHWRLTLRLQASASRWSAVPAKAVRGVARDLGGIGTQTRSLRRARDRSRTRRRRQSPGRVAPSRAARPSAGRRARRSESFVPDSGDRHLREMTQVISLLML